jgi:hypothetical protein
VVAVGLALVQTVICNVVAGWQGMPVSFNVTRQTPSFVTIEIAHSPLVLKRNHFMSLFVMGFIAWAIVLEMMVWWYGFMQPFVPPLRLFIVGVIGLTACCWWAFGKRSPTNDPATRTRWAAEFLCLLVLVLLAFRTDGLFTTDRLGEDGTFYHWGVFIGPAEAVRQGGWLLWDVPFQYGFLSTLSLAALPVPTAWQSLYLLNAIGSALVALFLFFVIRALHPSVRGSTFAFVVAASVVYLVAHWPPNLTPPHYHPGASAFRFVWCYVLVGVLLLERRQVPRSRAHHLVLLAGTACWLLAILWSAESAFYGSAIWLPAFGLMVLRDYGGLGGAHDGKKALFWLAVPPLLLAGTLGVLVAIYQRFLGQGPDLRAYVDAMFGYSGTFMADLTGLFSGTDLNKTIMVVVFGFLLLAMTAASIARTEGGLKDLPIALGLAFGMWGLASYPVGLPVPYAIYRLMPYLVLSLGVVLALLGHSCRGRVESSWVNLVRTGAISLLAGLLVTAYTNFSELQYYASAIRAEGFHGRDVTVGLPRVDPSLAYLLQQAEVNAKDPIFYAGAEYGDMMPAWVPAGQSEPVVVSRQWMFSPPNVLLSFPDERKHLYMERYTERQGGGGWLIERRQDGRVVEQRYPLDPWLFEYLDTSYTPTRIVQNGEWQLVWYEPKANAEAAALAGARTGRVPGLPADLLVNGLSLAESVQPPLWGYFGPEWSDPALDGLPRCTSGPGTLSLFTPAALEATLALDPPSGGFGGTLQVVVNDGAAVTAEHRRKGDTAHAPVLLNPGWNTLTIAMTDAAPAASTAGASGEPCTAATPVSSALRVMTVYVRFGNT